MYYITCCNGYYIVGSSNDKQEALRIARSHQDGDYDCIIQRDGRIIGDMGGYYAAETSEYYRDAATQTGMYDAW